MNAGDLHDVCIRNIMFEYTKKFNAGLKIIRDGKLNHYTDRGTRILTELINF